MTDLPNPEQPVVCGSGDVGGSASEQALLLAVLTFIDAVRLDRIDWQEWPEDAYRAFNCLRNVAISCKTSA